jgi:hypothetical protein
LRKDHGIGNLERPPAGDLSNAHLKRTDPPITISYTGWLGLLYPPMLPLEQKAAVVAPQLHDMRHAAGREPAIRRTADLSQPGVLHRFAMTFSGFADASGN